MQPMREMTARMRAAPVPVRAATAGFALIVLALGAWMVGPGRDSARVPVAPVLQSETTAGDPAPTPPDTTSNSVVQVTEASGAGSQSLDVSSDSSASAPPSDVSAQANVDQSSTQVTEGTSTSSTSESTSDQHSSTTSGDGSSSTSVELNNTSSNQVVTTGPVRGLRREHEHREPRLVARREHRSLIRVARPAGRSYGVRS